MSVGKLPEEWVKSELDNVLLTIIGGGTPSKAIPEYYQGDIPWMSVKDMNKHALTDTVDHITHDAVENSSTNIIPAGTPIIATRMSLGKIVTASFDSAINQDLKALFLSSRVDRNFFIHWYRSQAQLIESLGTGTTVKGIRLEVLKALTINLPPLAEQKVIAEKLDTLLAQVDSTKARLEQIPQILKRFRQAVLANALRGKLTSKWRIDNKNLQNISSFKASVKRYRFEKWVKEQEEKFTRKGKQPKNDNWKKKYKEAIISQDISDKDIPDGWLFEPLDGLVYISARIGWKGLKASEYTAGGPLFLSVHSLNYGKEVNLSQAYHISEHRYDESPEIKLQNDDVLLCKDGAGIGKLAIVRNLNEPATINSSLLLIRAGDFFIPEYLFYFLSGPEMQNLVKERMTGSAVPHLFQRDVKEFVLEVPPLNEQHEIVRRVEQLFGYADTIEKQVNNALVRVNNLTQSILAKAFRGELTAQWRAENPDLISGENSAAALLEKIKAERAATASKKAPRKKT
ncbi:TPA: restriction endonuclease subunit S [Yersinia enterocolitica]|uniref:restriction endonuclease subunit S n=1 Tax=Yersinia kristensenii TaxID=28152 RepID=UPI001C60B76E|nr:restriction endonuclease subunit S [Yersinia kristensenii]MBW5815269.1 restriction endonuclease subunit S [Yersinia kristensenii]